MDLRNIRTFIRVAELGSITKCAVALGYVQSAVTMQIQQLERELGYPLFDRIGKKIYLTPLGNEFLSYAYDIMRSVFEAENLDKNIQDIHALFKVGILESLLFSKMLPVLPEFKSVYSNIDIELKMGQASELLQQLKQNQLDIVYISAGLNTDPDLCCYYKHKEQLIFVCNPEHIVAKRKKVSMKELFHYDFIVTEHSGICYRRLQELAEQYESILHTSIEVDSTIAIINLLQNNMALAFLPEYSVQRQLADGTLAKVDVDVVPCVYYSQIIGCKRRWFSPFMKTLIDKLECSENNANL